MKTQAKIPIKKAVCIEGKTAKNNNLHSKHYQKGKPLSSFIQIGELLFLLLAGHGQAEGWQQFDRLLRQFYEGRIL